MMSYEELVSFSLFFVLESWWNFALM